MSKGIHINYFRALTICCLSLIFFPACGGLKLGNSVVKGDIENVRQLVTKGADVNEKSPNGVTALMLASEAGHTDIVTFLLQQGADVNSKALIGFTPLFFATENSHIHVAKVLLQNGADVNVKTNEGFSPIYYAIQANNFEMFKFLIKNGANLKVKTNHGLTPLMSAAYHQSKEIFNYLLDQNVDLEDKSNDGRTVLSFAAMGASHIDKDFDPSTLKKLINAGADLSVKDKSGRSIFELVTIDSQTFATKKVQKEIEEYNKKNPGAKRTMNKMWMPISYPGLKERLLEIEAILSGSK